MVGEQPLGVAGVHEAAERDEHDRRPQLLRVGVGLEVVELGRVQHGYSSGRSCSADLRSIVGRSVRLGRQCQRLSMAGDSVAAPPPPSARSTPDPVGCDAGHIRGFAECERAGLRFDETKQFRSIRRRIEQTASTHTEEARRDPHQHHHRTGDPGVAEPARTRPRVEGEREREILEAALDTLADVGYDRLNFDAVASAAKASKATLYRRWPGKVDLVVDALQLMIGVEADRYPDTGSLRGDLIAQACAKGGIGEDLPGAGLRRAARRRCTATPSCATPS